MSKQVTNIPNPLLNKVESLEATVDYLTYNLSVLERSNQNLQSKYDELGASIYAFGTVLKEFVTKSTSLEVSVDSLRRAVDAIGTVPASTPSGFKYTANDIALEHLKTTGSTTSVFKIRAIIGDVVRKNNLNSPDFATSLMTTKLDSGEAILYNTEAKTVILQMLGELDTSSPADTAVVSVDPVLTAPAHTASEHKLLEYLKTQLTVTGKTWTELSTLTGIPRTSFRTALIHLLDSNQVTYTHTISPPCISITIVS